MEALISTHPFALFDYFRVPYRIEAGCGSFAVLGTSDARVAWPIQASGRRGLWWLGETPVHATLAAPGNLLEWQRENGRGWSEVASITDGDGRTVGVLTRSDGGTLLLPFDPGDAMTSCWSEAYMSEGERAKSRFRTFAMRGYYVARPAMPRALQLALRRAFSRIQARSSFPRWPVESGLHDLYDMLLQLIAETLGERLPALAIWPDGKSWAFVLTHDVEHAAGYRAISVMCDLEARFGYRSAWYLVPERDYRVDDDVVAELWRDGFEVGVHGLHHDGRDLLAAVFHDRLPAMHAWRDRWGATGFRSPATHRDWRMMPQLGFEYDTSSFDTDPFEPQAGGCCTWLPFENGNLVELPMTLTMDSTVFMILRRGAQLWEEKAEVIRRRGGMAMLLTHPDYMTGVERLSAYESLLRRYSDDESVWRALPGEVSAWWRRRAASSIQRTKDGSLQVVGPAAGEARIVLLGGHWGEADAAPGGRQ